MKTRVLPIIGLMACILLNPGISEGAFVWDIQRVDIEGYCTSLALDPISGYPSISYVEWYPNLDLKYAGWDGSNWVIQTMDSGGEIDEHTSLALDPATGYPHITYHKGHDGGSIGLWYAFWDGSNWQRQHVEVGDVGRRASLALDPDTAHPRILYTVLEHGRLKYASWNGSSWDKEVIDDEGDSGDLVLDPETGYPRVAYLDRSDDSLKYLSWDGTEWDAQTVASSGHLPSLSLDPNTGHPKISYFDRYGSGLFYASWNGATWDIQLVDSNGGVGHKYGRSSLVLDPVTGYPRIAYFDEVNEDLKFAAWNGGVWETEVVEDVGTVGEYSSLALDPDFGYPCISYLDREDHDLKYATGTPEDSITVTFPNGGDVLFAGSDYEITWMWEGDIEYVNIEYSVNSGADWMEIATSTENDGSHSWRIPCDLSDDCLAKISDADDGPSDTSDDVFSIIDNSPPSLVLSVEREYLWPPNHKMVDVGFECSVSDNCDPHSAVSIVVTSDESTATAPGGGGPKHAPDAEITEDGRTLLRAERSGEGDGRVYGITVTATDASGNNASSSVYVKVNPSRKDEAIDSGQNYDATEKN